MIVAIDFDGTIVEHQYPRIGQPVPGAIKWMKEFNRREIKIILWTLRSGVTLDAATAYLKQNGVEIWGVNENPEQREWSDSPKAYAHQFIDDAAAGCPLVYFNGRRAFVNWEVVGPLVFRFFGFQEVVSDDQCPVCGTLLVRDNMRMQRVCLSCGRTESL